MKTALCIALPLLLILTGCGGDYVDDSRDVIEDLVDVLKDVKDADSAQAAKSDLNDLVDRMKELQKREEELSKEEKAKAEKELMPLAGKLTAEMMRVAMIPEARQVLEETFKELGK